MEISLFVLAVSLMFSGAQGIATSRSCSYANGEMICTEESGPGSSAISGASSFTGGGSTSQNAFSKAGDKSTSQSVRGSDVRSSDSGSPNINLVTSQISNGNGAASGFAFTSASSGSTPGFLGTGVGIPFGIPGFVVPIPGSSAGTGATTGGVSGVGGVPAAIAGPLNFVNQFFGGGGAFGGAAAFAGPGIFPFGRR